MTLKPKHYSVTFSHFTTNGQMDGFHAIDLYSYNEKRAIERATKKFKKLHTVEFMAIPINYYDTWHRDCEVI